MQPNAITTDASICRKAGGAVCNEAGADSSAANNRKILSCDSCLNIIDGMSEGLYVVDRDRRITYWNSAAEKITGYLASEIVNSACHDNLLQHIDEKGNELCVCVSCPLHLTIQDGDKRQARVYLRHKDGRRVPVMVKTVPIRNADNQIVGAAELFHEIGVVENLRMQIEELAQAAHVDQLTGLANRRFLDQSLVQRLDEWNRYGWPFGCFLADIDNFKIINDTYGHTVGDIAIKTISHTMAMACRSSDLVGRWGGDEIMGLLKNVDHDNFVMSLNRLCVLTRHCRVVCDQYEFSITISIGGSMAKKGDTVADLLERADVALYKSKHMGRDQATVL